MPLKKSKSRKSISQKISELMHYQAIAIAMHKAGMSKSKNKKKNKGYMMY